MIKKIRLIFNKMQNKSTLSIREVIDKINKDEFVYVFPDGRDDKEAKECLNNIKDRSKDFLILDFSSTENRVENIKTPKFQDNIINSGRNVENTLKGNENETFIDGKQCPEMLRELIDYANGNTNLNKVKNHYIELGRFTLTVRFKDNKRLIKLSDINKVLGIKETEIDCFVDAENLTNKLFDMVYVAKTATKEQEIIFSGLCIVGIYPLIDEACEVNLKDVSYVEIFEKSIKSLIKVSEASTEICIKSRR